VALRMLTRIWYALLYATMRPVKDESKLFLTNPAAVTNPAAAAGGIIFL